MKYCSYGPRQFVLLARAPSVSLPGSEFLIGKVKEPVVLIPRFSQRAQIAVTVGSANIYDGIHLDIVTVVTRLEHLESLHIAKSSLCRVLIALIDGHICLPDSTLQARGSDRDLTEVARSGILSSLVYHLGKVSALGHNLIRK